MAQTVRNGSQRVQIRHISLGSAFKIGMVLSALLFAIFGMVFLLGAGAMGTLLGAAMPNASPQEMASGMGLGLVGGVIGYIAGIFVYGILGGIGFALNALFYNIVAGMVGGIEVDLA